MLLRNSISNTKKFFQKTIDNVKSFLSKGSNMSSTYERLPKSPPFHPFSCGRNTNEMDIETGYTDLDNFYAEFTHQWDSHKSKLKNKGEKKSVRSPTIEQGQEFCKRPQNGNCDYAARREAEDQTMVLVAAKQTKEVYAEINGNYPTENNIKRRDILTNKRSNANQVLKLSDMCSRSVREKRLCSVAEKLKEMELMDKGNVNHKLDIEEILHYYSRLTCPAYLDIVDKFFMEMCAEFFSPQASQQINSTPKLTYL